jgi:uncharacterized protein (TIGR03086 family)
MRRPATARLEEALSIVGGVVDRIELSDRCRPTPCEEWAIDDVLNHMVATTMKFTSFATGETERPATPSGDVLGGDHRASFHAAATASRVAWIVLDEEVGAITRCRLPFGDFSPDDAAAINMFDAIVHGWDLSRAIGATFDVPIELVGAGAEIARSIITPASIRTGHYGEPQHLCGRTELDRLVALTGRDPGWTPR